MGLPLVLLAGGAAYLLLKNQGATTPASASVNPLGAGAAGVAMELPSMRRSARNRIRPGGMTGSRQGRCKSAAKM